MEACLLVDAELIAALGKDREIRITVLGRRSRRRISLPVWFVLEAESLILLPVGGTATEWYRNLQKNPTVTVSAGDATFTTKALLLTEPRRVEEVVEKFRARYGTGDVKRYYSRFDACVKVPLG